MDPRVFIPGGSSITDLVVTLQNMVQAGNAIADAMTSQVPHFTSGTMSVATVVSTDFTRLTGISVVAANGSNEGTLHDALSIASADATNLVAIVPKTTGYVAVQAIFQKGVVYKPGTGQSAVFFFAKT